MLLQNQPGQLYSVVVSLDLYIWRVTVKSWDFAAEDKNWSWRLNMMWNVTSMGLWDVIKAEVLDDDVMMKLEDWKS